MDVECNIPVMEVKFRDLYCMLRGSTDHVKSTVSVLLTILQAESLSSQNTRSHVFRNDFCKNYLQNSLPILRIKHHLTADDAFPPPVSSSPHCNNESQLATLKNLLPKYWISQALWLISFYDCGDLSPHHLLEIRHFCANFSDL